MQLDTQKAPTGKQIVGQPLWQSNAAAYNGHTRPR